MNSNPEISQQFTILWEQSGESTDVAEFLARHAGVTAEERLEILLDDQRRRWKRGIGRPVEEYIDLFPEIAADGRLVLPLLTQEHEFLKDHGEGLEIDSFIVRFPELREELEKLTRSNPEPCARRPVLNNSAVLDSALPAQIGRYRTDKHLGAGGFGRVFQAWDDQLARKVAIKVPHPEIVARVGAAKACLDEARAVGKLDHPNIVPVYDAGSTDEFPVFIVSKYVEGECLAAKRRSSRFDVHQAARLIAAIAEALHHAHKHGVVHRDVKPSNILIGTDGIAYLVDFGLALRDRSPNSGDSFKGTARYMSPEQARGESDRVDGRSDIFSLGIVFYELLVGRTPFLGETTSEVLQQILNLDPVPPRQLDHSVPPELERICLKALARNRTDRYTNAADMSADLRKFLRPAQRTRRLVLGTAAVIAALAVVPWILPDGGQPVRVESVRFFQILRNDDGEFDPVGAILESPFRLRVADGVRFHARLSEPAYCYWIAFRPDGVVEVCAPEEEKLIPVAVDKPKFPQNDERDSEGLESFYEFNNGAGSQSFALVISRDPLPAFEVWIKKMPPCPWSMTGVPSNPMIRHHDGYVEEAFELGRTDRPRGKGTKFRDASSALVGDHNGTTARSQREHLNDLVNWFRQDPTLATVEIWMIPVLPREP